MSAATIAKEDQVLALLNGQIYTLVREHDANFTGIDCRPYISVTRADVCEYVKINPSAGNAYLEKVTQRPLVHEATVLRVIDGEFEVAWNDHGRLRFVKRFKSLPEAVAEHVMREHGLG